MESLQTQRWEWERRTLELLSALSYRTGELGPYLHQIATGVSQLIDVDWSVITLCQNGYERVLASSLEMGSGEHIYDLHGQLTGTVVERGCSLVVEDARTCQEYGEAPEGYLSYLGVPLRSPQGEVMGTICSFHQIPRQFTPEEVKIAELFADRAATAIDNFRLYEQQRRFNECLEQEVAARTAELHAAQAQLVAQERLAAIGEFASMIVHEIRNPLTTVGMGLKYFNRLNLDPTAQERLTLALDELLRLENLLREILQFAKPQVLQLTQVQVNELIQKVIDTILPLPLAATRQLKFTPNPSAPEILADPNKLQQALINILSNACEAVSAGATIQIEVQLVTAANQLLIQVNNGGDPIPPTVLAKLTQPFYTTKAAGTGLGLAIVKRIVDAHGGELKIESTAATGTTVSLQFPIAAFCDVT